MEKSIDTLRAEMWRDRFEEESFRLRDAQEQCAYLATEYHKLKDENERLLQCLKDLVDAGTNFLMSVRGPIDGIDGSREAQLRDAIEKGRKWNE